MSAVMHIIYWKKGTTEHTDINKSNTTNEKKSRHITNNDPLIVRKFEIFLEE